MPAAFRGPPSQKNAKKANAIAEQQLATQQQRQDQLDAEQAARSRNISGRNRGRNLLAYAGQTAPAAPGSSATLG